MRFSKFGYGESNPELPRLMDIAGMRGDNVSQYTISDITWVPGVDLVLAHF